MKKEFILSSPSFGVYDAVMRISGAPFARHVVEIVILSFSNYDKAREFVETLQANQSVAV